jgi:tRNA (guanine37-N1)-methyltransferase
MCQDVLRAKVLKDHLGHVDSVHPRIRLVRSYSDTHQLILCNPKSSPNELPEEARDLLQSLDVQLDGPNFPLELSHANWTVPYILQQVLPEEVHPPPTAFEQIGHVAHLNLKPQHLPYSGLIGQVLVENIPHIETVVNKLGEVSGDFRTYDMQVLAGRNDTNVKLVESGIKLHFDLKDVYWCSRLSGERDYMLKNEFKKNQVICDPFCGVGAQVVQAAAKLKCKIIANDWNPDAVAACKQNAVRNGVQKNFIQYSCQDAYEFLTDVGLEPGPLPHHVVMNFPLESPKFVSALRWWPAPTKKNDVVPTIHLYTFARDDEESGRRAESVAVDMVAENLLPLGGAVEEATDRRQELDALGCNVRTRSIRDVAPGKVVVCVSFQATRRLIKHIQGDFM